jgi:hypothetical protein
MGVMRDGKRRTVLSYVLPLCSERPCAELSSYLAWLATRADVIVVDGSEPRVFNRHADWWSTTVRHLPVAPHHRTPMGKVGGVLTGLDHARCDGVVIADDDVRYDETGLEKMERLLERAEVVRPQNVFTEWPWHAWWDTGRTLLARASGGDWPGTLGVRRDALAHSAGYRGDVLFENLELVRTVRALGGREHVALDLVVDRIPPTSRHFLSQRTRQAYDEFARPIRLAAALSILPAVAFGGRRVVAALLAGTLLAGVVGRRRAGGASYYPAAAVLAAPLWLGERSVTAWLALGSRAFFGGIRYGAGRLRCAASSERALRAQLAGDPCCA